MALQRFSPEWLAAHPGNLGIIFTQARSTSWTGWSADDIQKAQTAARYETAEYDEKTEIQDDEFGILNYQMKRYIVKHWLKMKYMYDIQRAAAQDATTVNHNELAAGIKSFLDAHLWHKHNKKQSKKSSPSTIKETIAFCKGRELGKSMFRELRSIEFGHGIKYDIPDSKEKLMIYLRHVRKIKKMYVNSINDLHLQLQICVYVMFCVSQTLIMFANYIVNCKLI